MVFRNMHIILGQFFLFWNFSFRLLKHWILVLSSMAAVILDRKDMVQEQPRILHSVQYNHVRIKQPVGRRLNPFSADSYLCWCWPLVVHTVIYSSTDSSTHIYDFSMVIMGVYSKLSKYSCSREYFKGQPRSLHSVIPKWDTCTHALNYSSRKWKISIYSRFKCIINFILERRLSQKMPKHLRIKNRQIDQKQITHFEYIPEWWVSENCADVHLTLHTTTTTWSLVDICRTKSADWKVSKSCDLPSTAGMLRCKSIYCYIFRNKKNINLLWMIGW